MKKNDILLLLIPICVLAILWVLFSIYHSFITSTIPASLNTQIVPINPSFDINTISKIKEKSSVEPIYSFESGQIKPEVPTPTISEISSPSGEIASPGGQLQ